MADNVGFTPGTGATIATDDVGGVQFQKIKIDVGADGLSLPLVGDAAFGIPVDVKRTTLPTDAATLSEQQVQTAALGAPTDAEAAGNGSVIAVLKHIRTLLGTLELDTTSQAVRDRLPTALVGGRLDVQIGGVGGALGSGGLPVSDNGGSLTVDDGGGSMSVDDGGASLTVDGSVTSNQGTANTAANAWPVKLSDGTNLAGLTNVGGNYALNVNVLQAVGADAQTDKSAFTEGVGKFGVMGGVFNDATASDPSEDQAAAARITAKRGVHVNLRKADGTEIGTDANPVRTSPASGAAAQPVSGTVNATLAAGTNAGATAKTADLDTGAGTDTVTLFGIALPASGGAVVGGSDTNPIRTSPATGAAAQPVTQSGAWTLDVTKFGGSNVVAAAAGIPKVGLSDEAGAAFSETNPVPVCLVPSEGTKWKSAVTFGASQTDQPIYTPTAGRKFMVEGIIITPTAAGALLKIYDHTSDAVHMIFQGQPPLGSIVITPSKPIPSVAVNNILRYSTGVSAAGDITAWGYEV